MKRRTKAEVGLLKQMDINYAEALDAFDALLRSETDSLEYTAAKQKFDRALEKMPLLRAALNAVQDKKEDQ